MSKRIVEIVLPEGKANDIVELLYERELEGFWQIPMNGNKATVRILLSNGEVEAVLDILEPFLETLPDATAVLLDVAAAIPRKSSENNIDDTEDIEEGKNGSERISRHELYNDISSSVGISNTFLIMTLLSAIVAAIGLLRNDMGIIIGAMVMAPLLVPNVAVALASTLGDTELVLKGLKATGVGFTLAIITSIIIGLIFPVDPTSTAIAARTHIQVSDLLLAMASGAAGVLAFTSGGQLSLIGVMVAVALMPPLVTAGLLVGSGNPQLGIKALELTLTNVICVNIAGILTFIMQGISPATWWEKHKASKARKKALLIWSLLLFLLAYVLFR